MKHLNSLFILAFLTISLLTTKAQTSVVIDPDNYKTKEQPFIISNWVSGEDFYLAIKTGEPVWISFADMDKGTGIYYKGTAPARTTTGDTVQILAGDVGNYLVNFNKEGVSRAVGLTINYQADIFDRTIGSATYGKCPDFIWVNAGGSATVSAGKYMAAYRWKESNSSSYSLATASDSIRILSIGTQIGRTNDGSGLTEGYSNDTISILEKPTYNNTAKTLNFPSTTTGITYKLLKVSSISGTDTTWTETQSFVGDGNAKNITLTDGKYKLTTTLGIHTAVYPYGYFVVGITTALDKTKEENITYRLVDNQLQFDNEVNLKFYSLQGQLLQQENGNSFKLVRQTGIFKATDKNGNTLTAKILLK